MRSRNLKPPVHAMWSRALSLAQADDIRRPDFMTFVMWTAWLLRGDVRGHSSTASAEGQREFVAWWLLFGRDEYPKAWGAGPVQIAVAMEPVEAGRSGFRLPRLLRRVHASRADLQLAFPLTSHEAVAAFCSWYVVHGPHELACAPPLPAEFADLIGLSTDGPWSGSNRTAPAPVALSLRAARADLQSLFNVDTAAGRVRFEAWFAASGRRLLPQSTLPPAAKSLLTAAERKAAWRGSRRFGVNLVGFARAEFGVGEDVRMAAAALDEAEVPYCVVDVRPVGSKARLQDRTLEGHLTDDLEYPVTLLCMTGFDTAGLLLSGHDHLMRAPKNIGYWPWELPRFPMEWQDAYTLVDEVWAASSYTAAAYKADGMLPVRMVPAAVAVPPVHPVSRSSLGLPEDAWVVVCPFDPNSHIARKNPGGAIRAFQQAFPDEPDVLLLLRANGDPHLAPGWDVLQAAIDSDSRIRLVEGTLERGDALGVLACCNAMLSLHRAEGFGRNIAEAILLGVPVLATGFSGCADFLEDDESISWQLRPIANGEYPFSSGQFWAEPDYSEAAHRLRSMRRTKSSPAPDRVGLRAERFASVYGPKNIGAIYRRLIEDIAARAA